MHACSIVYTARQLQHSREHSRFFFPFLSTGHRHYCLCVQRADPDRSAGGHRQLWSRWEVAEISLDSARKQEHGGVLLRAWRCGVQVHPSIYLPIDHPWIDRVARVVPAACGSHKYKRQSRASRFFLTWSCQEPLSLPAAGRWRCRCRALIELVVLSQPQPPPEKMMRQSPSACAVYFHRLGLLYLRSSAVCKHVFRYSLVYAKDMQRATRKPEHRLPACLPVMCALSGERRRASTVAGASEVLSTHAWPSKWASNSKQRSTSLCRGSSLIKWPWPARAVERGLPAVHSSIMMCRAVVAHLLFLCSDRANAMMPNRSQTYIQTSRSNLAGSSTGCEVSQVGVPCRRAQYNEIVESCYSRNGDDRRRRAGRRRRPTDQGRSPPLGQENAPTVLVNWKPVRSE